MDRIGSNKYVMSISSTKLKQLVKHLILIDYNWLKENSVGPRVGDKYEMHNRALRKLKVLARI